MMKNAKPQQNLSFEAMHLNDVFENKTPFPVYYQLREFELIWIKKGNGFLSIDFDRKQFSDNTLYCLLPGQIHRFEPGKDIVGYRIVFTEDFLRTSNRSWPLPDILNYTGGGDKSRIANLSADAQEIEEIIGMILWEYDQENMLKEDILHGLLKLLIAHISGKFALVETTWSATQVHQIYNRFMEALENSYMTSKQVSDYASELAVSASYLSEVVKRVSGFPASYHIQQRILLEAKRRVICDNVSMKQIAFDLGFDDPSTFSKFFKSCTGRTFSDFRMAHCA